LIDLQLVKRIAVSNKVVGNSFITFSFALNIKIIYQLTQF